LGKVPPKNRAFAPAGSPLERRGGRDQDPDGRGDLTCAFVINHVRGRCRGAAPSGSELPPRRTDLIDPPTKKERKRRKKKRNSGSARERTRSSYGERRDGNLWARANTDVHVTARTGAGGTNRAATRRRPSSPPLYPSNPRGRGRRRRIGCNRRTARTGLESNGITTRGSGGRHAGYLSAVVGPGGPCLAGKKPGTECQCHRRPDPC
jgi:hypothetical protein